MNIGQSKNDSSSLLQLAIEAEQWEQFLYLTKDLEESTLNKRPYSRFLLTQALQQTLGQEWLYLITETIKCARKGGVAIEYPIAGSPCLSHLKLATALAYALGSAHFDEMTGHYYADIQLTHESQGDSFLLEPFLDLRLHTDGTFYSKPVDWIILAKTKEEQVLGGQLSLHHLHDLENLTKLLQHPLAFSDFCFQASASKKTAGPVEKSIFFELNGQIAVRFSDQFCHPQTMDQALFLHQLSESLESSAKRRIERFPVGQLIILNNSFWLHGRLKIEPGRPFDRRILRLRGKFYSAKES